MFSMGCERIDYATELRTHCTRVQDMLGNKYGGGTRLYFTETF